MAGTPQTLTAVGFALYDILVLLFGARGFAIVAIVALILTVIFALLVIAESARKFAWVIWAFFQLLLVAMIAAMLLRSVETPLQESLFNWFVRLVAMARGDLPAL